MANFNDTLLYLRGNTSIDYDQLGLKFRLFSCEVLFNRGLCYIYLRQMGPGLQDLEYAAKEQVTPDHAVIDDALREHAEVCFFSPFSPFRFLEDTNWIGLHRLLNSRRGSLPPQRSQGQESQDQRLPRQGSTDRSIRPIRRSPPQRAPARTVRTGHATSRQPALRRQPPRAEEPDQSQPPTFRTAVEPQPISAHATPRR